MRLIDADALKQKITMVTKQYKPNAIMERPAILLEDVDEAPTIDAEPVRHGKWIVCKGSNGKDYRKCSECLDTQEITGLLNYCPVCGAKMDEDEVEE